MRRRARATRYATPCPTSPGAWRSAARVAPGRAAGGGAVSATAATSTPPAASSHATWRLSGPLPATSTRVPGSDPVGTRQRLGRPSGHDAGKRPAGDRMRPLVRPGGDDELARADPARAPVHDHLHFRRRGPRAAARAGAPLRVGAPHGGGAQDLRPRGPHPLDEVGAGCELPIARPGPGEAMARGELLEVLPAGMRPLIENRREHPGAGGRFGRREPGRSRTDDEEVALDVRNPVRGGRNEGRHPDRRDGRRVVAMGGDRHSVPHRGHARPLPGARVHRHQALVADPHAAEDAARVAAPGPAKRGDAGRGERGGHRFPLDGRDRPALEVDGDGRPGRNDPRGSQAKGFRGEAAHLEMFVRHSISPSERRSSHVKTTLTGRIGSLRPPSPFDANGLRKLGARG